MSQARSVMRRAHPELDFGGFTDLDGTVLFYTRVRALLRPDAVAVDVGCGRGTLHEDPVAIRRELRTLRGNCRRLIGIDVDPVAAHNPYVDEFRLIPHSGQWPLEDRSADLAVADFVLEHVVDPSAFFAEAARVLRPGAVFCIRTINSRSYVALASRLIPSRLHEGLLGRIQPHRRAEDVFPGAYRCNSVSQLRQALQDHGFDAVVYGAEAEPAYLGFSRIAYTLGLAYRRLAPGGLRVGLIAWGRRQTP
jgi:SAM-dependent methyltransferase